MHARPVYASLLLVTRSVSQLCDDTCASDAACAGDVVTDSTYYDVCYPSTSSSLEATVRGQVRRSGAAVESTAAEGRITVVANYQVGCNAGRREASLFPYVAQLYANEFGTGRVSFLSTLKGGSACGTWATTYVFLCPCLRRVRQSRRWRGGE